MSTLLAGLTAPYQDFHLKNYPALSVGIIPFTLILFVVDSAWGGKLKHIFSLDPYAPFRFDLNKLSFYVLYHNSFIHWLLNVVALFSPMVYFERSHGTVHTGITLNLLAVTAALQYCIVGMVLYRHTHVIGISGIVFLFITYFAVKEHEFQPVFFRRNINGREIVIPTKFTPFITLLVCTIILPGSSFFGHLAGISSGYLLAYGKLKILYPPLSAILFIENKLAGAIKLLDGLVQFIHEEDAVSLRTVTYEPIFSRDAEVSVAPTTNPSYISETNVLGR